MFPLLLFFFLFFTKFYYCLDLLFMETSALTGENVDKVAPLFWLATIQA
jgi:hypothetical protein